MKKLKILESKTIDTYTKGTTALETMPFNPYMPSSFPEIVPNNPWHPLTPEPWKKPFTITPYILPSNNPTREEPWTPSPYKFG